MAGIRHGERLAPIVSAFTYATAGQCEAITPSRTQKQNDMSTETKEQNHAELNAKCWIESLNEMLAKLTLEGAAAEYAKSLNREQCVELLNSIDIQCYDSEDVETLAEAVASNIEDSTLEPDDFEFDEEQAREEIQESPLSVQVRSGWVTPGEEMGAEEFEILLTTGGPALRIRGELDEHKQPDRAYLEYQDWGTPWTQYFDVEQDTLLAYCQQFYFGE